MIFNSSRTVESLEPRRLLATTLIADIEPGSDSSHPNHLTTFGDAIYFTAGKDIPQLYRTNGTEQGTARFAQSTGVANDLIRAGDRLYFYEVTESGDEWFLASIGPQGDFHRSLIPGPYTVTVLNRPFPAIGTPRSIDGQIFYYQLREDAPGEWFTSDQNGDVQPTGITDPEAFADRGTAPAHSNTAVLFGRVYFAHDDGMHGRELALTTDITLTNEILRVYGTPGNDRVTISSAGIALVDEVLTVNFNGITPSFPVNDLAQVRVYGGDGNDRIMTDESGFKITTPVSVLGGNGNDLIRGGSGADTIYGEDGDDTLYGGEANDRLWGGNGNDRINGGGGRDVIFGNAGLDTFVSSRTIELRDFSSLEDLLG